LFWLVFVDPCLIKESTLHHALTITLINLFPSFGEARNLFLALRLLENTKTFQERF
jgi:hypothetical protein